MGILVQWAIMLSLSNCTMMIKLKWKYTVFCHEKVDCITGLARMMFIIKGRIPHSKRYIIA